MTLTAAPDTRPAPVEPTTPIRPSEAIRLGCLIAPVQAFEDFEDGPGTACVEGAIGLAIGDGPYYHQGSEAFIDAMDDKLSSVDCPVSGCHVFWANLPHLNDKHRWSRERIADWLEGLGL